MRIPRTVALLSAAIVAFSGRAHGEVRSTPIPVICGPTAELEAKAASTGAFPYQAGMAGNKGKALGELFLGDDGTWAFFLRLTDGTSCVIASGDGWRDLPAHLKGDPS